MEEAIVDADKFRAEFLRVLRNRRSGEGARIEFECCFSIICFSCLVNYDVCSVLGCWKACEFVSEILSSFEWSSSSLC